MIEVFSDWLRASCVFCQVAISAEFYAAAPLAGAQTFQVGVTATNGDGFSGKNGLKFGEFLIILTSFHNESKWPQLRELFLFFE